jgi:hypothetical protein
MTLQVLAEVGSISRRLTWFTKYELAFIGEPFSFHVTLNEQMILLVTENRSPIEYILRFLEVKYPIVGTDPVRVDIV